MAAIVRCATEADMPAINDIYNEAVLKTIATMDTVPKTLSERLDWFHKRSPKHVVLVVEVDTEVCGWASLNAHSDRVAYAGTVDNSVYIKEKYYGRGYGTLLMDKLVQIAQENLLV